MTRLQRARPDRRLSPTRRMKEFLILAFSILASVESKATVEERNGSWPFKKNSTSSRSHLLHELVKKNRRRRTVAIPFHQCTDPDELQGVFGSANAAGLPGCTSVADFLADASSDLVLLASDAAGVDDGETAALAQNVIQPAQDIFKVAMMKVSGGDAGGGFCLGDFKASDVVNSGDNDNPYMHDTCAGLPLGLSDPDATWSILSFHLQIPPPLDAQVCGGTTDPNGVELQACLAIATCNDELPSVAFSVNGDLLGCLLAQLGAVATAGIASILGKAVDVAIDNVAAGFSLTNSFAVGIHLYDGAGVYVYQATPTIFDRMTLTIDTNDFGLGSDYLRLSGTITRGLSILAPTTTTPDDDAQQPPPTQDEINAALASYDASGTGDVTNAFVDRWTVEALFKGELSGELLMRNIPVIGAIFPNLPLALPHLNGFLTTGDHDIVTHNDGVKKRVHAGVSIFVGGGDFLRELFSFVLEFAATVVFDLLPDWIDVDVDTDEINDAAVSLAEVMEQPNDSFFGAGLTVNSARTGVMVNLPLIVAELGQIRINCYTDYNQFNCEVNADGLITYITAAFEAVADGVVWVLRKTDEFFQQAGRVIAVGLENAVVIQQVFSPENLARTAEMVKDGIVNLANSLVSALELNAVIAKTRIFLRAALELLEPLTKAVREIAQWGQDLIDKAGQLVEAAIQVFEEAAETVEQVFNCVAGSIADAITGQTTADCDIFQDIKQKLEKFANDIVKVLEDIIEEVGDFFEDVGNFVVSLFWESQSSFTYENRPGGVVDSKTQCPLQNVIRTTKECIKIFGIVVSCTTHRTHVAIIPERACVKSRVAQTCEVVELEKNVHAARQHLADMRRDNADSVAGTKYAVEPDDDIRCKTKWKRGEIIDTMIPLQVTCTADRILPDGSLGQPFSITRTRAVDTTDDVNTPGLVDDLLDATKNALLVEITTSMHQPDAACVPTPGRPGDGIDNDCNGMIDDDVLCHDADRLVENGLLFDKDCKCAPPTLAQVPDLVVPCSADLTALTLGRPTVTLSSSFGCPTTAGGDFEMEFDEILIDPEAPGQCGAGQIRRGHRYRDAFRQTSNMVYQTITLQAQLPKLDSSVLPSTVTTSCADPVPPGLLAPAAVQVPEEWATSSCARELEFGYEDVNLTHVGCSSDSHNNNRGWHVQRRWFVQDECSVERVEYVQTVIRQDLRAPNWVSTPPPVRVQSVRASIVPLNTGIVLAQDECDGMSMNPDNWTAEGLQHSGNIQYTDTFDVRSSSSGQAATMVHLNREFIVQDSVCNAASFTQDIQASATFDFQKPLNSRHRQSSALYDSSTKLPIFDFLVGQRGVVEKSYTDQVYYIQDPTASLPISSGFVHAHNCSVLSVEYLNHNYNTTNGERIWHAIPHFLSDGVFTFRRPKATLHFEIDIPSFESLALFEQILTNSGGKATFRIQVDCELKRTGDPNLPLWAHGYLAFHMASTRGGVRPPTPPPTLPPGANGGDASQSCTRERTAYQACFEKDLANSAQSRACLECVNGALPFSFAETPLSSEDCARHNATICTLPQTCQCASCADEMANFVQCLAGCGSGQCTSCGGNRASCSTSTQCCGGLACLPEGKCGACRRVMQKCGKHEHCCGGSSRGTAKCAMSKCVSACQTKMKKCKKGGDCCSMMCSKSKCK